MNDPEWARVRPPLVELTTEQAKLLAAQLGAIGFAMPQIGNTRGMELRDQRHRR
jgi:hypothetical protein